MIVNGPPAENTWNAPGRTLAGPALLVALVGQGLFMAYVAGTGLDAWPRGEPARGAGPWLADVGLLALFALQHSGMARPAFKHRVSAQLERPLYVTASGLSLLLVVMLWQPLPGDALWNGPVWISALSVAAALLTALCFLRFAPTRFLGLSPSDESDVLRTDGPYRWVRHPLMLGLLLFLWAQPVMPPELFVMNVGLTAYILAAIQLEERDLIRQFGPAYEAYRRRVPMLLPWRGPTHHDPRDRV